MWFCSSLSTEVGFLPLWRKLGLSRMDDPGHMSGFVCIRGGKGVMLLGEVKRSQQQTRPSSNFVWGMLCPQQLQRAQFNSKKGGQGPRADIVELEIKSILKLKNEE